MPVVHSWQDDGATERSAKLVAPEGRHGLIDSLQKRSVEIVAGIQVAVAKKFESAAMELVGAGFCGDRHHARPPAELGRKRPGEDFEFADGLHRRLHDDRVERILVVVNSIDEPRIRIRLAAERVEV